MKLMKASTKILASTPDLETLLELAGRTCYKSEDAITADSAASFIGRMHDSKHESVLEHGAITVRFICDRGISHELVRHRLASFSQESTRYCNYSKDKFGAEITVIDPRTAFPEMLENDSVMFIDWLTAMERAEEMYFKLLGGKASPQLARAVLPNSLKTEVVVTANPREWLHIFRLRCSVKAHPQIRELMIPLQQQFQVRWPAIFGL